MKSFIPVAPIFSAAIAACALATAGCYICTSDGTFDMGLDLGAKAVREETHELAIQGDQRLSVDVRHGDLHVHASSSGTPTLHATITSRGMTSDAAQHVVDAAHLSIESTSEGVFVRVQDSPADREVEGGTMRAASRFDLDLQLPAGVRLSLATGSGDIEVVGPFGSSDLRTSTGRIEARNVEGDLTLHSSAGDVEANAVHGERIEAITSHGCVRLASCSAKSVIGTSDAGDVRMQSVTAERVEASSGHGDAELEHVHGDLNVKLSSGSLRVEDLSGARHDVKSEFGSLRIAGAHGDLTAETSSGSISIADFDGRLRAHSSYGSIHAEGVFLELAVDCGSGTVDVRAEKGSRVDREWKLSSSYGAVKLGVPSDIACELAAKTGFGGLDVRLPIEVPAGETKSSRSVRGKIRGGGELVSLESSSGSVSLYPID